MIWFPANGYSRFRVETLCSGILAALEVAVAFLLQHNRRARHDVFVFKQALIGAKRKGQDAGINRFGLGVCQV